MNRLKVNESLEATKQLWSFANGLELHMKKYTICMVNGVKFHTKELNNRRVTQNSGVYTKGDHKGEMHDFYGHVCKIWELEYMFHHKVVLFQCEWYNTGTNGGKRMIRTNAHCTSIDVTSQWYQNDPFILPSQAKKVFYLHDTKLGEPWQIVQCIQHKGVFNVLKVRGGEPNDNTEDSDAFQEQAIVDAVPINVEDNIEYCMGDVEAEVVPKGGTLRDANQNEEHDIPDVDLDIITIVLDVLYLS